MSEAFFDLSGRVAIITGASRGLGQYYGRALARAGADLVITGLPGEDLEAFKAEIERLGRRAYPHVLDVREYDSIQQTVNHAFDHYGKIDILVNNAGCNRRKPSVEVTWDDWNLILDTNLRGTFFMAQAVAIKAMIPAKYGRIINIASPVPASLGERGQTAYAAASAAVQGLTRALAVELGRYGITVNCVCPDYIDTEMMRNAARREGMYLDDFRRFAAARIPAKRLGTPEDVAGVTAFLASEDAGFVSGQIINVRGGP